MNTFLRLSKNLILVILAFLIHLNSIAQKVTATPIKKIDAYSDFISPIGNDEEGYVILNFKKNKIIVQGIELETFTTRTGENVIKVDKSEQDYNYLSLVKLHNKNYLLYYKIFNKTTFKIFARQINLKSATVDEKAIEILTLNDVNTYTSKYLGLRSSNFRILNIELNIIQNLDKTLFSLVYSSKENKENNKDKKDIFTKTHIYTFNSDLELVYQHNSNFPYATNKSSVYTFTLDNEGNIYYLLSDNNDEKKRYELHKIGKNINLKSNIDFDNKIPNFSKLTKDAIAFNKENNTVSIIGYYFTTDNKIVEGYYKIDLNNNKENLDYTLKTFPFSKFELTKNFTNKMMKNLEKGKGSKYDDLHINKIIYRGNDHYTIYSEITKAWYYSSSLNSKFSNWHYSAEDILMSEIEGDNITYFNKFSKKQESIGEYSNYLSFSDIRTENGQYLFFYDNEDNTEINNEENPKPLGFAKNNAVFYIFIDKNGKATKKILEMPKGYHCFGRMVKVAPNKYVVGSFKGLSRELDLTMITVQ